MTSYILFVDQFCYTYVSVLISSAFTAVEGISLLV